MSNNSVSIYSFPTQANARGVTTPSPQAPAAAATGATTVATSSAGSEAARASGVVVEGPSVGHEVAAQGQLSHFKTAKADAYLNTPTASAARTMNGKVQPLELGSKGPDVYALQLQLIRLGHLTPEQVSAGVGIFSDKTCAAVRSFQEKHGLEPNGVVGRETREAIILARVDTPFATPPAQSLPSPLSSRPAVPRTQPPAQAPPTSVPTAPGNRPAPATPASPGARPVANESKPAATDSKPAPAARGSHHPSAPSAPAAPVAPAAPAATESKPTRGQHHMHGPMAPEKPAKPAPKPALPGANQPKSKPVDAPQTNAVGDRNKDTYKKVIDQFDVAKNKRYEQGKDGEGNITTTYCNIFVWDVTRAMGAEIPHWVDTKGNPTSFGVGYELDANGAVDWVNNHGTKHGWRKVDDKEAQSMANEGHPAAVLWKNPGGIGHLAMVRPGEITKKGPAISQSGARNLNEAHVYDIFGATAKIEYWVHD